MTKDVATLRRTGAISWRKCSISIIGKKNISFLKLWTQNPIFPVSFYINSVADNAIYIAKSLITIIHSNRFPQCNTRC